MRVAPFVLVTVALLPHAAEAQAPASGACPGIVATRPTVVPSQRFRAGELVPAYALDEPLRWVECPAPEYPAGAPRDSATRAFLFVTVDESGAVVDIKPRGTIDPQGFFDSAVAAVRRWRSTAPKWRSLAVRSNFAADIIFDPAPAPANTPEPVAPAEVPPATPTVAVTPPAQPSATPPAEALSTPPPAEKPAPVKQDPLQEPEPKPAAPPATAAALPEKTPPVTTAPSEPAKPCPTFVVFAGTSPPLGYSQGDTVPPGLLDTRPVWISCEWPEPAEGGSGVAMLSVVVDDSGAVIRTMPRGTSPDDPFFQKARDAVMKWRSTPLRYKGMPVRTTTAMDIRSGAASAVDPPSPPAVPTEAGAQRETAKDPSPTAPSSSTPADPPASSTAPAQPPNAPATSAPAPAGGAPAQPAPVTPISAPEPSTPVPAPPVEPARPCPNFFVLPSSDQPRSYRAGELVPNAYLDAKPVWVACPPPDFTGVTTRSVGVIVVIDDKGAVRDVRPRGQAANAAFRRARETLTGWRVAPPPRYKALPVWTSTALDIRNDAPQQRAADPAPATPTQAPAAVDPVRPTSPPPQSLPGDAPFAVEYYYKAKWGFAAEFWQLFVKNHLPILRKQIETGRILEVRADQPVYHATEEGRWDYRVTIVFRNVAAAFATVDTAGLERQLFPDQETFRREEQRRFELLLAHWDAPVTTVALPR